MMAVDRKQIEASEGIDLTRCYAKLDRFLVERQSRERHIAMAAVRAGDDSPWMVLKTMSGRELAVHGALDSDGIEALVPMKMGKENRRRRFVVPAKKEPVFIGYIFVRCVISNEAIAALLGYEYVLDVLGGYERPYLVDAGKVKSFNEKADCGHYDHEVPQQVFQRGMKVIIREGIFAGSKGIIVSGGHNGKGNAVVDITFLGGPTHTIMPLAILAPL